MFYISSHFPTLSASGWNSASWKTRKGLSFVLNIILVAGGWSRHQATSGHGS